jgi:hypothetical protein
MKIKLLTALLVALSVFPVQATYAEDDYVEDTDSSWGRIDRDDGFERVFTLYKDSDNYGVTDYGDDITYTIEVQCSKKKLGVIVYGDPDIYPRTDLGFKGTAQMKVDKGKIIKHSYIALRDSSGVQFNNPKNITRAILSSKDTFSFKIPSSIQNDAVANFSKLDFASYAPTFKSLGCLLK